MLQPTNSSRSDKCKKCLSSVLALTFSTLGLIVLIISYIILGGFLFHKLEANEEERHIIKARIEYQSKKEACLAKLWNASQSLVLLDEANYTAEITPIIDEFQQAVYNITKYDKWDGLVGKQPPKLGWSLEGAALYAVTAITTIGYGHVSPKTAAGKIITILYCIIGLPLTLMCIAKLGRAFAFVFRVIYHTCCCAICCLSCMAYKRRQRRTFKLESDSNSEAMTALAIMKDSKNKSGSIVVGGKTYKQYTLTQQWHRRIKSKYQLGLKHESAVPTYLCLLVMAAYIAGGSVLFSHTEDWDSLEGAYFCFITLTTIGFGDYVPGIDKYGAESINSKYLIVFCALYVLIGLAFIGMCIDLMQVDVTNKIKSIARFLGLSDSKHKRTHTDKKIERVGLKLCSDSMPVTSTDSAVSFPSHLNLETASLGSLGQQNTSMSQSMPTSPQITAMSQPPRSFSYSQTAEMLSATTSPDEISACPSDKRSMSCDVIDLNSNMLETRPLKKETSI